MVPYKAVSEAFAKSRKSVVLLSLNAILQDFFKTSFKLKEDNQDMNWSIIESLTIIYAPYM